MIINENLKKNLLNLKQNIELILDNNSLTNIQTERFLKTFEKTRYNILNEIKLHNKTVDFEYEKIKTLDDEYKAEFTGGILKIYVPEVLPSYKNIKTHTHKRILLNVSDVTKPYADKFGDEVFIYIKVIKPISDALILSGVIKDDNMAQMFYCSKGEYSENPHTEIYVFNSNKVDEFLENTVHKSREFFSNF